MSIQRYADINQFNGDLRFAQYNMGITLSLAQFRECYALYVNAKRSKGCVLGGGKILGNNEYVWQPNVIKNFHVVPGYDTTNLKQIPASPRTSQFFRRSAKITPQKLVPGAVLAGKEWTILGNDAYILGSIHSTAGFALEETEDFHLCLPVDFLVNPMPYLWNYEKNMPRVTGRELIGLDYFGYELVITETRSNFMMQFRLPNSIALQRARESNLTKYAALMKGYTSVGMFEAKIQQMLHVAKMQIRRV